METKSIWTKYSGKDLKELEKLNKGYIDFLSECKTEREATDRIVADIEKAGYKDIDEMIARGGRACVKPGDKLYRNNMGKGIIMFNIGDEPIEDGMNILGAHIDSPRLDVKQNPLYEDGDIAYLDTHYYGGIKKYQYVTIPLALHGVFVRKDGSTVKVRIGEDPSDPVFFVSDLLIHLAEEQMVKRANKVVEGEALDLIVGNRPVKIDKKDEKKDGAKSPVKEFILDILKKEYKVEEDDFMSAELEIVPAGAAREAGLDRSMVLSYGQDDRVCAYTSYIAMLAVKKVKRTSCCILVDKEEIGSVGATGMQSKFFENTVAELISMLDPYASPLTKEMDNVVDPGAMTGNMADLILRRCLANSNMLSSDVNAAFDPLYAASFEKKNTSYMGRGLVLSKFTGSRGKYDSNDANAEYLGHLRNVFDKDKVAFQTAELGKVDIGGGGTIAYILALYGMNVIDSGVAVLSMHSPWEATSKADVYEAERGYEAFLKHASKL